MALTNEQRIQVVENYYRASHALMEIGILPDLPEELSQIVIRASACTTKIIDYVNDHRFDGIESEVSHETE